MLDTIVDNRDRKPFWPILELSLLVGKFSYYLIYLKRMLARNYRQTIKYQIPPYQELDPRLAYDLLNESYSHVDAVKNKHNFPIYLPKNIDKVRPASAAAALSF